MKKRSRRRPPPLPLLLAELTLASWETVARRAAMMAAGTCSPAEYRRMVAEKARAAGQSYVALIAGSARRGPVPLLTPWHRGATANARRLRRR
jgi:hypothetical protein